VSLKYSESWKPALLHAVPIFLFVLGVFYYWFAVADRYAIFLYGHLGATPFDEVTSSRYWMSGLVAAGFVMVGYAVVNWLLGRMAVLCHRDYSPPAWWRVWILCAPPLAIGILAITMTVNWPILPPSNADRQLADPTPFKCRRLCGGNPDRPGPRAGARLMGCPAAIGSCLAGVRWDGIDTEFAATTGGRVAE